MFIRFKRGVGEVQDSLTLPQGELAIDLSTKALHFHDGESPGGYRALGEMVWRPPLVSLTDFYHLVHNLSKVFIPLSGFTYQYRVDGPMTEVEIGWVNRNADADGIRVYRSESTLDPNNLPPPRDSLEGDAEVYIDPDVEQGKTYQYLFEVFQGDRSDRSVIQEVFVGIPGPGPSGLVAGSTVAGFCGEVPVSELITGTALATLIGLTTGTAQFNDEPWLKFIHHGKVLYVAKKPYRHSISWDHLHARDAVMGIGSSVIEIGEDTYKCRLLTGANTDPTTAVVGTNPAGTEDSEWNQLMYPIHVDDPEGRAWAQYTDADLLTHSTHGDGTYSWCQETAASNAAQRVIRGYSGVAYFYTGTSSITATTLGWRPCLELL